MSKSKNISMCFEAVATISKNQFFVEVDPIDTLYAFLEDATDSLGFSEPRYTEHFLALHEKLLALVKHFNEARMAIMVQEDPERCLCDFHVHAMAKTLGVDIEDVENMRGAFLAREKWLKEKGEDNNY